MRYNLPYGRLRYDINPSREARSRPKGISHRRYIARVSVYRKSRQGFISRRSVPWDTALNPVPFVFYYYLFCQVLSEKRVSIGKSSRRPASMSNIKTIFDMGLNAAKF